LLLAAHMYMHIYSMRVCYYYQYFQRCCFAPALSTLTQVKVHAHR